MPSESFIRGFFKDTEKRWPQKISVAEPQNFEQEIMNVEVLRIKNFLILYSWIDILYSKRRFHGDGPHVEKSLKIQPI
jgi:hypothetical protein